MRHLITILALCIPLSLVGGVVQEQDDDSLTEWEQLQLAIIITESRCNPQAVGKTNDKGILQITPIYVKEANRLSGREYSHEDAFDIQKSLEMFEIIQNKYNPEHDVNKAIKLHNPGSNGYAYRQNLELVKRMELVRKEIKK